MFSFPVVELVSIIPLPEATPVLVSGYLDEFGLLEVTPVPDDDRVLLPGAVIPP